MVKLGIVMKSCHPDAVVRLSSLQGIQLKSLTTTGIFLDVKDFK